MEEKLLLVKKMINESLNIPNDIKGFVLAICKGYIKHSNGMISLRGIENVCKTKFVRIEEGDKNFATENNIFGETTRKIFDDGSLVHTMSYVNVNSKVKLVIILLHELGHIITEYKVNTVLENGGFPFLKSTLSFYTNLKYIDDELKCSSSKGIRINDGFLETICGSIFSDLTFREEIKLAGCDLGDYVYKDNRLFPSRVYDEFRDCFQLFNEIMNGKLFEFACMDKDSDEEYINFINKNRIHTIFGFIDKTLESLWKLKKYENNERDSQFDLLLSEYFKNKNELLMVADILTDGVNNKDRVTYLRSVFANMRKFGNSLPFSESELAFFDENKPYYGK